MVKKRTFRLFSAFSQNIGQGGGDKPSSFLSRKVYIRKYESRCSSTHLFLKNSTVRFIVPDPFFLPDAILLTFLPFSFFYLSVATFISLSSRLPFGPSPVSYFFSLSHSQSSRRFLRHRPRSMSICIICFVSDSSGSSWRPAIFGAARSIDLTASAKTRRKLDSSQPQDERHSSPRGKAVKIRRFSPS